MGTDTSDNSPSVGPNADTRSSDAGASSSPNAGASGKAGGSAANGGGGGTHSAGGSAPPSGGSASPAGGSASPNNGKCPAGVSPDVEVCDDVDNDCDGTVDEDLTRACGASMQGVCHKGKQTCAKGAWSPCEGAVEPTPEICDSEEQDENCDGVANEGCACTPGKMRACGKTAGICVMGQQTCAADGTWGTDCVGEVKPMPEVCDGVQDEDCDGLPDAMDADCECINGKSVPCVAGMGICADGMKTCANGKFGACKGPAPKKEVCDGKAIDEDCDGSPDNGCACTNGAPRPCPSGTDLGECSIGMQTCTDGQWGACMGSKGPGNEKCDGMDSNCNGVDDDAEPNLCGAKPCLHNGSNWGCAKCTAATVAQDCPGASACRMASCSASGDCKLDNAGELTFCPGSRTHEAYCRSGACVDPGDADGSSSMAGGSALYPGGMLHSSKFELQYQPDGNVTLWAATHKDGGDFVWCLFNTSEPTGNGGLVMQPDGNFVLWAQGNALWQSHTGGQPDRHLVVSVTDNGHVYIKDKSGNVVKDVIGDYKGNVVAQ